MAKERRTTSSRQVPRTGRKTIGLEGLGLKGDNLVDLSRALQQGLPFAALDHFQKDSGLPADVISRVLHLPRRTLARRKVEGTLTGPEGERLARLAALHEKAVGLFEGDAAAARRWLLSPNKALRQLPPLTLAETEIGARAVEDLIGRLEYGVYS